MTLIVSGENIRGRHRRVCLEGGRCGRVCLKGVGEHNNNDGSEHNGGSDGYSEKKWEMVIRKRKGNSE